MDVYGPDIGIINGSIKSFMFNINNSDSQTIIASPHMIAKDELGHWQWLGGIVGRYLYLIWYHNGDDHARITNNKN